MSEAKKTKAKRLVGELLVEEINNYLDSSKSPVSKAPFKKKKADGTTSRLFEDGDLRSQITFLEHDKGVKVGIFENAPEVEKLKSYNHNVGDTLPQRQFIPMPDQEFKKQIKSKIRQTIEEVRNEEPLTVGDILENLDES